MKERLALATLALLAACGSAPPSTDPGATASFAGTWYLASINGFPLPFDVQTDSGKFNIRDDVLTIADSGSWGETASGYAIVGGGALQTRVRSKVGTWTRGGAMVTLRNGSGTAVYQGTVTSTRLELTEPVTGFPFVFVHAIPSQ